MNLTHLQKATAARMARRPMFRKRLLKLIVHLEHGKLGHRVFDFGTWNSGEKVNHCRTNGCAIGECPVIFPKHWSFRSFGTSDWTRDRPVLRGKRFASLMENDYSLESAAIFFGVDYDTAGRMFTPELSRLSHGAKRKTVAKHLRKFI